jgi:hypothetical protein
MDRREMLGVMGAGAVGLTALSGREAVAQAPSSSSQLDSIHKECLEACSDCARACDMAFHHCVTQVAEGKREHAKPLQYFADCAGFCGLAACNIAKHSPLMAFSCESCGDACKATLAVVNSSAESEAEKAAIKALTRCEKSCTAMVEAMGHHHH